MNDSPNQRFRRMCLELLDAHGHRNPKSNVWTFESKDLYALYESGRLIVQDVDGYITVWSDRDGGAQTSIVPYFRKLQALMVLDLLADIE